MQLIKKNKDISNSSKLPLACKLKKILFGLIDAHPTQLNMHIYRKSLFLKYLHINFKFIPMP